MEVQTIKLMTGLDMAQPARAYIYLEGGLGIHRALVPSDDDDGAFTFSQTAWTVTHIPSQLSVLRNDWYLDSYEQAMAFCEELVRALPAVDWTSDTVRDSVDAEDIRAAREAVKDVGPPASDHGPQTSSERFVVRRNESGSGFCVYDTYNQEVIQRFPHRGLARDRVRELVSGDSI